MPAAIATLAVSGPQALALVERFVPLTGPALKVGSLRYGTWRIANAQRTEQPGGVQRLAGEQVVLSRPAPDRVEVHCHGGAAVCQALLNDLASAGCVVLPADQWPSQLNCPLARAAEEDLQRATTDRAAAVLLDQLHGALRNAIQSIYQHAIARDMDCLAAGVEQLLQWADFGMHLSQPWRIALAGPPNVGKSSLLNALAGTRQAIVHHEPGTTRDWLEWPSAIDGWPVMFTDTAGVRQAAEPIEQAGVERGLQQLREADLAVLVVDAQQGWTDEHDRLLACAPQPHLLVCNKVDLAAEGGTIGALPAGSATLRTCAVDGTGIAALLEAMAGALIPEYPQEGVPVPFRAEHVKRLNECLQDAQVGNWLGASAQLMALMYSD